jgi:serine phosphatase RsbU (regulator of sigma subunit)
VRAWMGKIVARACRRTTTDDLAVRQTRARADRQAKALLDLASGMSGAATVAGVADVALAVLDPELRPAYGDITVVTGGVARRVAALRSPRPDVPIDLRASRWAAEVLAGAAVFVEDRAAFAAANPSARVLRVVDAGAWALLPLRAGDETVGVLALHWAAPRPFAEDERLLLEAAAGVVATALRRAQLYERLEREAANLAESFAERDRIARTLQTTLLPPALPTVPGFDVAARLVPGTPDEVGGDIYDVFESPAGGWVALVGDVCGKGAEAAAVAALARHAVRAMAVDDPDPVHLAAVVNDALIYDASALFCTMAIAHVGPDGALRLVLAGHDQARVVRAGGAVERVGHLGRGLGILPATKVAAADVVLATGDALVLHTDGVIERDPSFGDDELDALLARTAGVGAARVVAEVLARVQSLPKTHVDDVAVLVLARVATTR